MGLVHVWTAEKVKPCHAHQVQCDKSKLSAVRAFYLFTLLGASSLALLTRCPLCPSPAAKTPRRLSGVSDHQSMEHCRIGKTNPLGNPIERQPRLLD